METKIFNQDGKVIINVPALAVAYTTDEAFKLVKLLKKHIKEANEYKKNIQLLESLPKNKNVITASKNKRWKRK